MRNLFRNRRGSAAFATVVALVPLIGVVALGGEAGSWYVTKQHAQNAADAAAYSGGLVLACQIGSPGGTCTGDTHTVAYRAGEFAAQNGFCDTSVYPSCTASSFSQQVTISTPTTWNGKSGNFVRAIVQQTQPAYLAALLLGNGTNVTIPAQAVAQVLALTVPPCILALHGSVGFQGNPTVTSPNCGVASNSTASGAISFTGNSTNVNAPSYTVGGCSETGGTQCSNNVATFGLAPVPNPLSGLDSAMSTLTTSSFSGGQCPSSLTAYETKPCYNNGNVALNGTLSGTYYFNGSVTVSGSAVISGTATLVLFGNGASLKVTGNPNIQLTAEKSPAVPPALSSVQSLMTDLLIYDPEPFSKQGVNVTGNSSSYFNGIVYVPNTPVTYGGNSSVSVNTSSCFEVIAYAVTFSGDSKLDNSKCKSDGAVTPQVQYVALVQ